MRREDIKRYVVNSFDDLRDEVFDDAMTAVETELDATLDMPFLYEDRAITLGHGLPNAEGVSAPADDVARDEAVIPIASSGLINVRYLVVNRVAPRYLTLSTESVAVREGSSGSQGYPEWYTPSGLTADGQGFKIKLVPGLESNVQLPVEVGVKFQRELPKLTAEDDSNMISRKYPNLYKYGILVKLYEDEQDEAARGTYYQAKFDSELAVCRKWIIRFYGVVGKVRTPLKEVGARRRSYPASPINTNP